MGGTEKKLNAVECMAIISMFVIAALTRTGVFASEQLVLNGSFARAASESRRLPADWDVPPDSPWHRNFRDGHSTSTSLSYSTNAPSASGPVTQTVSLEPGAAYILSCAVKPDERLKPVIRLRYPGPDGAELARIAGCGTPGIWTHYFYEFSVVAGGDVEIELWPDVIHLQRSLDIKTPAGTASITDVQIFAADRAGEIRDEFPGTVGYRNLALGKSYVLEPSANYQYSADPGDARYLTDGQYTVGYFWTQKTTVGWVREGNVTITIDLEELYPIKGVMVNSGFGTAGAKPPSAINILVSEDGMEFKEAGDLVSLSGKRNPVRGGYSVHRFYTGDLEVSARYVRLDVEIGGNTFFVDEVEVYRAGDG